MSHNIEVDVGTSVRLKTAGKYCDRDIVVTATGGGSSGDEWIGDGNTHIWISLPEGRTSPMLGVCVQGTVTVDWGDGSEPYLLTGTTTSTDANNVRWTPTHEYGKAGDYVITLTVDGAVALAGRSSSYFGSCILRYCDWSDTRNVAYQNFVKKLEIGAGVTSIGPNAFYNCKALTKVMIHEGVTFIDSNAFYNCSSLASVHIPESVTSLGSNVFHYCHALASVTTPESLTLYGTELFSMCYALAKVNILKNVTSINNSTFYYCQSLPSVEIPDGVTSIGDKAFYGCGTLGNVTVPGSVTSIGDRAFYDCAGLAFCDFTNHTSVPTLAATNAFNGIPSDCQIRVPSALVDEWKSATNWSTYASKIVGV